MRTHPQHSAHSQMQHVCPQHLPTHKCNMHVHSTLPTHKCPLTSAHGLTSAHSQETHPAPCPLTAPCFIHRTLPTHTLFTHSNLFSYNSESCLHMHELYSQQNINCIGYLNNSLPPLLHVAILAFTPDLEVPPHMLSTGTSY